MTGLYEKSGANDPAETPPDHVHEHSHDHIHPGHNHPPEGDGGVELRQQCRILHG